MQPNPIIVKAPMYWTSRKEKDSSKKAEQKQNMIWSQTYEPNRSPNRNTSSSSVAVVHKVRAMTQAVTRSIAMMILTWVPHTLEQLCLAVVVHDPKALRCLCVDSGKKKSSLVPMQSTVWYCPETKAACSKARLVTKI